MTKQRTLASTQAEADLLTNWAAKTTVQTHLHQLLAESDITHFAFDRTKDHDQCYLSKVQKRESKGIYTVHNDTGVIIFCYPTVFKDGNGTWFTLRTGKMINVDYDERVTTAKEIVAKCLEESELIEELIASEFPYFNMCWDESEETQKAAKLMEDLIGDISMFKNKNGNWITLSIDPSAHF
jgi:hypothetical protein